MQFGLEKFAIFAAVVKHMNVTRAAHELRTSQPSVSKRLRALEETYKLTLFHRNGKGLELSDEGQEFLKCIQPILDQMNVLESRYLKNSYMQMSSLKIGASYVLSAVFLPALLKLFNTQHPTIQVVLRSNGTLHLEQLVLKGAIEIMLSSIPPHAPELISEPYMPLKLIAFAAKDYPLPRKRELSLDQVKKLPFVIREGGMQDEPTKKLLEEFRRQGCQPKIVLRCESPEAIKMAVMKKLGVGFLYEEVLKDALLHGLFKKVCIAGLPRQVTSFVVYHRNRSLSTAGEAFLTLLRQSCTARHNKSLAH